MKSFAFFVALFAAGASAKHVANDADAFKLSFSSIKDEADKFSARCRDALNGEGPTFTIDVSDHSLSDGVGEKEVIRATCLVSPGHYNARALWLCCVARALLLFLVCRIFIVAARTC